MSQSEGRIEELDLLRALAITMVIIHHVGRGILKTPITDKKRRDYVSRALEGADFAAVSEALRSYKQ
jgi:peptidoglycan/LPS O-acetylase OafA/YrhL